MNAAFTPTGIAVLAAVQKLGPVSSQKIADHMGKTTANVNFYLRALHSAEPKQVYVFSKNDTPGAGRDPRLWAAGDLPDAVGSAVVRAPLVRTPEKEDALEEKQIRKDIARVAAQAANRVRRDPMLFLTAGVAP